MHPRRTSGGERRCAPLTTTACVETIRSHANFAPATHRRRSRAEHARRLRGEWADLLVIVAAMIVLAGFVTGCGTMVLPGDDNAARTPLVDGKLTPAQSPVFEDSNDNSLLESAQPATLPEDGQIVIEGAIDPPGDIDLYALGPAHAGDMIIIDVTGQGSLNTVAALFDGNGDLIDANNDRAYYSGNLNPYVGQVLRVDSPNLFLGIAASTATQFAAPSAATTGAYSIRVTRGPGRTPTAPRPQVVWLDFEGGESVQIALEPVVVMHTFSAEAMSARFAGQTPYIIDQLIERMRRDLAAYNVVLLDSKHNTRPAEPYSKLYFGNYNVSYLGLADSVDTGNVMLAQEAIIYSEDLAMFEGLQPSAEEAAQALANIASHELGHLLGLEHTQEPGDLMATASSARQILEIDAEYRRARLEQTIFPMGWQNNPSLLLLNVGRNPESNGRWRLDDLIPSKSQAAMRESLGLPDISISMCGRCTGVNCSQ